MDQQEWRRLADEVARLGVADEVRRDHVADEYGRCRGCASHSVTRVWPCNLRLLADPSEGGPGDQRTG